jgi:uncharacterized protein involved in exopolysaccharide biosynthesis
MSAPLRSPRPVAEPAFSRDDVPSLAEVASFLLRYRWLIAGTALAAAIAAFVVVQWGAAPRYRAVATLLVVPPRVPGNLQPKELPIQAYERVLASDAVLAETRRRLAEEVDAPAQPLRLGDDLAIRLSVAERTQLPLAPTLELVAFSPRPERSAAIANTWSAAFLEHWALLSATPLETSSEFVASEFSRARDELARLQEQASAVAAEGEEAIREIERRWERRIAATADEAEIAASRYRRQSDLAIGAYNSATRGVLQEVVAAQVPAAGDLGALISHIVSLRARMAESPEVMVLVQAPRDEAVSEPGGLRAVVREEEINPLHAELSLRVAELESQVEPLLEATTAEEVRSLLAALELAQRERAAGLRDLQEERLLGLDRLRRDQRIAIEELRRGREKELAALARRQQLAQAASMRELAPAQQLFDQLSRSLGDAELAQSSRDLPDVRLVSAASPPVAAQPRRAGFYAVVGLVLGGSVGLALAVARELSGRKSEEQA